MRHVADTELYARSAATLLVLAEPGSRALCEHERKKEAHEEDQTTGCGAASEMEGPAVWPVVLRGRPTGGGRKPPRGAPAQLMNGMSSAGMVAKGSAPASQRSGLPPVGRFPFGLPVLERPRGEQGVRARA